VKAFIWQRAEHVTRAYHDEGGVVAVAPDLDHARTLIGERVPVDDDEPCTALTDEPDVVIDVSGRTLPSCFIFPDAGCC
jgi:hypothetical protein